jgi:nucleotide-binding universal stress UspA family protein
MGLRIAYEWRKFCQSGEIRGVYMGDGALRTYLVVIDETPEAEMALRFAARRAYKTGGAVEILAIIPPQEFVAWGGVQATIEDEAREHAEEIVRRAIDTLGEEGGIAPTITVKHGDAAAAVHEALNDNAGIAALVLGASALGAPGPLVAHFAGAQAGNLPCPIMVVPGSLSREALDRLS